MNRLSITSEINRITGNIASAYAGLSSKGATLPQVQNSANLRTVIESIPEGAEMDTVVYSQVNGQAAAYLAAASYSPADYTQSVISQYASQTTSYRKDRPAGTTITVPAAGIKTVYDAKGSVTSNVTAGESVINNLTPNAVGLCVVRDQTDQVTVGSLLKPTGALRMIDGGGSTFNIRDLGGWSCDGGTLKYGLVFRGCELSGDNYHVDVNSDQIRFFKEYLGIRDEIDLRGNSEVDGDDEIYGTYDDITESALGEEVDYLRLPIAPYAAGVDLSNSIQTGYYAELLKRVISDVRSGKPCYIHCMAGADRTGTLCALIEALCGVSQSDADKDYELTSFSSGNLRERSNSEWTGLINRINSFSGSSFRDKVVSYALQAGVTIDEINALRSALIDGTPSVLTSPYADASITKTLSHTTIDNSDNSAVMYQKYEACLTPDDGYAISNVSVTMNGSDITGSAFSGTRTFIRHSVTNNLTDCTTDNRKISVVDSEGYCATITAAEGYTLTNAVVTILMGGNNVSNYYSEGKIAIPRVTGNLVITVQAASTAPAYTNQIPISTDSSGAVYNGVGYKDGSRLNSSGVENTASGSYLLTGFIPYNYGDTIRVATFGTTVQNKQSAGIWFFDVNKGYLGARRLTDMISDGELVEGTTLVYTPTSPIYDGGAGSNKTISAAKYIRIVFHDKMGKDAEMIATINEDIA